MNKTESNNMIHLLVVLNLQFYDIDLPDLFTVKKVGLFYNKRYMFTSKLLCIKKHSLKNIS